MCLVCVWLKTKALVMNTLFITVATGTIQTILTPLLHHTPPIRFKRIDPENENFAASSVIGRDSEFYGRDSSIYLGDGSVDPDGRRGR